MPDQKREPVIEGFDALHDHFRKLSGHCHGKQGFAEKGMAERIAASSRKRGNSRLGVYRCDDCKLWHIGRGNGLDGRK